MLHIVENECWPIATGENIYTTKRKTMDLEEEAVALYVFILDIRTLKWTCSVHSVGKPERVVNKTQITLIDI